MQVQAGPANGESTVHFIDSLRREFDGNVILIWDGLPAHRSELVNEYVKKQDWLTVVRLPAYAPELNPVEYLWSAMKTKYTANVSEDTIESLSNRIERAYNRYHSETQTLRGFLKASSLWECI
jgi:transposase